jgi:hypothetical protein
MPVIPEFINTLDNLKDLHRKKNDDYSGDRGAFFNFEFCDFVSNLFRSSRDKVYAVFVAVKLARLAVVLDSAKVNNESVTDSFDDLICYAAIWKSDYMERVKKSQPNREAVERVTLRETQHAKPLVAQAVD